MSNLSGEQRKQIENMLLQQSVSGRIECAKARAIAKSLMVPIKSVGMTADDMNIKISKCELGCF